MAKTKKFYRYYGPGSDFTAELRQSLPPTIPRHRISEVLGGIYSSSYMTNLDSQGLGPPKYRIGNKVFYLREDLIDWLRAHLAEEKEAKESERGEEKEKGYA